MDSKKKPITFARFATLLGSTLSGVLIFLSVPGYDLWPLAWLGFVPLLWCTRTAAPRRAFWWGSLAGLIINLGGFYWITNLMIRFGHLPVWFSIFCCVLLAAYQGALFGVFNWAIRRLRLKFPSLPLTFLAPLTMCAVELCYPLIFPWYIAASQVQIRPVLQVADLGGPIAVTFLLMLSNGLIFDLLQWHREKLAFPRKPLVVGLLALVAALVYGGVRLHQYQARWAAAPTLRLGLVQGNVGINEKGRANLADEHLQLHLQKSRELVRQGAQLLVWPESAYPFAFGRDMQRDWPAGHQFQVMRDLQVPLIFGTITYDRYEKYPYNTALFMEPDGRITGKFDKNYLLVFGEYIPFYDLVPNFRRWIPAASHFARGQEVTVFNFHQQQQSYRLAPNICYEDIIPSFIRRLAQFKPHLLVNMTNDAWFGLTAEPWQHLALAVFRTIEMRTGMVRAVNTGISVIIDATGKILSRTQSYDPVVTPGVPPSTLLGEVAMLEGGHTVYAAIGDFFGYLNLLALLGLLLMPCKWLPRKWLARADAARS